MEQAVSWSENVDEKVSMERNYRKDTNYSKKKGVKSAGRVAQSVRGWRLGRAAKCPDSTNIVSRINENPIFLLSWETCLILFE